MPKPNPAPLASDTRDQIIAELERYLRSDIRLEDACINGRYRTKVRWCREMLRELEDYEAYDMPYAPKDSPFHPQWAEAATKRTILFLQHDRVYEDGYGLIAKGLGYLVGCTLLIGFVLFMVFGLIDYFVYKAPWVDLAIEVSAFGMAAALALLFVVYAVGLAKAGVHIFRVRVLGQDLRPIAESDIWPYLLRADYEHDLKSQEDIK